jgi:hypothetical protein
MNTTDALIDLETLRAPARRAATARAERDAADAPGRERPAARLWLKTWLKK